MEATTLAEAPGTLDAFQGDPRRAIREQAIVCLICGRALRQLTNTHLQLHGTSPFAYKQRFGYNLRRPLMCGALKRLYAERAIRIRLAARIRHRRLDTEPELRRRGGLRPIALEEEAMRPPTTRRPSPLIVLAAAILFILLAVLEAMASHRNPGEGDPATPWLVHIWQVDAALVKQDLGAAERAWHDAYGAALGSRRWEGMVQVGDAALRIGELAGARKASEARARWTYRAALFRARQEGSLDGVLRVAEAFSALGDREVVAQCIRIAERLAARGRDAQAHDRVSALSERLANR